MLFEKIKFYIQLVIILLVVASEGKKKRRRKEQYADEPVQEVDAVNVCKIPAPVIIYCYCDTEEINQATEGNCWVFNDTSLKEYADIWEDFASQNAIKHFTLHLRTDGTVKRIPTIAFMHMKEIEQFEVQYATINVVHSFAFANSSTLREILLSRNDIQELEPNAFANHGDLKKIQLGVNQLTQIDRDVFVNLPQLTHLHIEQNNITSISDYAFHNLGSLLELDLFSNLIQVVVPATFSGLKKLEKLDLHHNRIEAIGDKTFHHLKSLMRLDLHGNSIKFISPKGLSGLTKLRKLQIQDNKLLSLGVDLFKSNEMLSYLDLSQNVLETIEEDAFSPIKKMLLQEDMTLAIIGNVFRCDTRLKWMFSLYNSTQSRSVKESLGEIYCYLESGKLPERFDPTPTQIYEVTTLGIGPRVQLMKLVPSELPDPMLRTPATFTEADCKEDHLKPTAKSKFKKHHKGAKRKHKHMKTHSIPPMETTTQQTLLEIKEVQNDMATLSNDKESPHPHLPPASPVQESMENSSTTINSQRIWAIVAYILFYKVFVS